MCVVYETIHLLDEPRCIRGRVRSETTKKGPGVSVFRSRRCLSAPVCARASVFFVSACVWSVLMCGRLYVQSLLSAVKLSFEALFNICRKKNFQS